MPGKIINIGKTPQQVRLLHAKRSLSYYYNNFVKDSNTLISTVDEMHLKNTDKQKRNNIVAGKQAVIANLKRLGILKEED
jgi:hypothetical protein